MVTILSSPLIIDHTEYTTLIPPYEGSSGADHAPQMCSHFRLTSGEDINKKRQLGYLISKRLTIDTGP